MLVVAVLVAKNVNKWGLFMKTDNTLKVVRKVFNISGIGFCVLAIIMLGIAFSLSSNNNEFYDSAQTTNGIVVFTRQSPSRTVIEYEVDGKTKKTDCKSTEGLPQQVKFVCSLKPNDTDIEYVIDGNLLTDKDSGITYFFKVEDKKIMVALTEDGTYSDILGLTYENSSIKLVSRGVTWVYDN